MRAALSHITEDFAERDFFRDRLTREELQRLLAGRPASDLFSAKSPSVKKLGLEPASMSEDDMLEQMVREPRLIRRPFLALDGRLAVQPRIEDLPRLLGAN